MRESETHLKIGQCESKTFKNLEMLQEPRTRVISCEVLWSTYKKAVRLQLSDMFHLAKMHRAWIIWNHGCGQPVDLDFQKSNGQLLDAQEPAPQW